MSESDCRSARFFSAPRARPLPSMQATHSYIEAHRLITPKSTRARTEPSGIDRALVGLIGSLAPQSQRLQKLLAGRPAGERRSRSLAQAELFERVYLRERKRMLSEVERAEAKKQ